jgi:hypothetical protein
MTNMSREDELLLTKAKIQWLFEFYQEEHQWNIQSPH